MDKKRASADTEEFRRAGVRRSDQEGVTCSGLLIPLI